MNLVILITSRFLNFVDLEKAKEKMPNTRFVIINVKSSIPSFQLNDSKKKFFDKYYEMNKKEGDEIGVLPKLSYDFVKNIINNEINQCKYNAVKLVCLDEGNLLLAAKLREHFNIPGNREEYVEKFTNKLTMKKIISDNNISSPNFIDFNKNQAMHDSKKYYKDLTKKLGKKFVLKPVSHAASYGVYLIKNYDDFTKYLNNIHISQDKYEAEAFIEGDLYHCDALIKNGDIKFITCCQYSCPNLNFISGENLVNLPLIKGDPLHDSIVEFTKKCLYALKVTSGAYHLELFKDPDGRLVFLEAAARSPGVLTVPLYEKMYHINMIENDFYIQCGVDNPINAELQTYGLIAWVPIEKGIVEDLIEPKIASQFEIYWAVKKGDILNERKSLANYVCAILGWNDDYSTIKKDFELLKHYKPLIMKNTISKPDRLNWQKQKILSAKAHQITAKQSINNIAISSREGKVFILEDGLHLVEFMCCSYLGLDQDKRLIAACSNKYIERLGVNIAISRTRIRANRFDVLESYLNKIFCNTYTVLFSSLHIMHAGIIPLIASGELPSFPMKANGCHFIVDKFAHASMQLARGIMEQLGSVSIVNFQNKQALENAFINTKNNNQTPVSISDSIISTGGVAPILDLLKYATKYDGYVYVDDAHGTSIIGTHGCGYTLNLLSEKHPSRLILAASLSKGFGSNGAVLVLPKKEDINTVKTFCTPYIFSNPPALPIIEASIAAAKIHLSDELSERQEKLWNNINLFDKILKDHLENYKECSPIRRVLIGDEIKAIRYAEELKKRGFLVPPSMFPSVKKGQAILRIILSAIHTQQQIQELAKNIIDIRS